MKKAKEVLAKLAAVEGVRAAVLVSGDGFPLEAAVRDAALAPDELAAVARDGVAAVRRMVAELGQGQFIQGVLESAQGSILFTNLPAQLTLVLVAARGANKAALWNAAAAHFADVMAAL
jgi:predicted regulator of Ras-like GTPase activity (Roadblock/LC7/MglB family)